MSTKRKLPPSADPGPRPAKLPKLPANYQIQKRPLLRPPIPSPHSSLQKQVFISSKTPFMAAVKRVLKLLSREEGRAVQSAMAAARGRYGDRDRRRVGGQAGGKSKEGKELDSAAMLAASTDDGEGEKGVVVKGTGRAVEKTLGIGVWFLKREGEFEVRIRTGTVGAVDDVVEVEVGEDDESGAGAEVEEAMEPAKKGGAGTEKMEVEDGGAEEPPPPSSRMRYASVVEVWVTRK